MTHDQLKSAIRQRMAETGEPYTVARREYLRSREAAGGQASPPSVPGVPDLTAVLRDAAAAQQAATAAQQAAAGLAASSPGLPDLGRDVAGAQQAAADIVASAAGLGEVVAAHRTALNLAGDAADLTDAERDAARQAAADLAASAAGLGEVIAAHRGAFEFATGSVDLTEMERGAATASGTALDLAHSSAELQEQLSDTPGAPAGGGR